MTLSAREGTAWPRMELDRFRLRHEPQQDAGRRTGVCTNNIECEKEQEQVGGKQDYCWLDGAQHQNGQIEIE